MNKKLILFLFITLFAFGFAVYQYVKEFQSEFASATGTKPVNGHLWSEMECDSSGLCVKSDGSVGIGTNSPSTKLEVNGSILASGTGDICNSSGKCLNSILQTNVIAGTNPVCPTGQTAIMKAQNGIWYTSSQVSSWTQVTCGQITSSDGTTLLVNSQHSSGNCTSAGGTVVSDGSNNMCRFNGSSCPSGWNKYNNWSTTIQTQVWSAASPSPCPSYRPNYLCQPCSLTTFNHSWSNIEPESLIACVKSVNVWEDVNIPVQESWSCSCEQSITQACYQGGSPSTSTTCGSRGYATITQIGCY